MKKIAFSTIFLFISTFINNLNAQEDPNCGVYVDGYFVDKLDCWTFDHMYLIFPIDMVKWKKYDRIVVQWYYKGPEEKQELDFTPQNIEDYFGNAKYGVWKYLTNKNSNKDMPNSELKKYEYRRSYSIDTDRETWQKQHSVSVLVYGGSLTGQYYEYNDSYGIFHKDPVYTYTTLYKSKEVPTTTCYDVHAFAEIRLGKPKCNFNIDDPCPVTGNKIDLKIEPAGGYQENLGVIKGNSNSSTASTPKTNAPTEEKTSPTKTTTTTPTKTNTPTTSAPTSALNAKSIKPLDKTKPGYFVEKNDAGKITREGYKKGNEIMIGEVRIYDDEGRLEHIYTNVNDELNGYEAEYDAETGNILLSGNNKAGQKDGEWKRYKDGKQVGIDTYVAGEKQ